MKFCQTTNKTSKQAVGGASFANAERGAVLVMSHTTVSQRGVTTVAGPVLTTIISAKDTRSPGGGGVVDFIFPRPLCDKPTTRRGDIVFFYGRDTTSLEGIFACFKKPGS